MLFPADCHVLLLEVVDVAVLCVSMGASLQSLQISC